MEQIYNKLVRDEIPEIIKSNGEKPIFSVLNDEKYKEALEVKLYEEYNEVIEATGIDRVEELADMIEVIRGLAKLENKELSDIINIANFKRIKKGGFEQKIFLEKVIKSDDN